MNNITYKKINNEYSKVIYGDFHVIMNMKNGYINATKLCIRGRNRFDNWVKNSNSVQLINFFQKSLNVDVIYNIFADKYVHPKLMPYVAIWVSKDFAYKVSFIIDDWIKIPSQNELTFWNDMGDFFKEPINDDVVIEINIEQIAKEENGHSKVETPIGIIDVLTDTKIIDVKPEYLWKEALGKVKCYSFYYPDKQKYIYLYNSNYKNMHVISQICDNESVMVKYI